MAYPGNLTFTANTITVPEQSYIDQAAESEATAQAWQRTPPSPSTPAQRSTRTPSAVPDRGGDENPGRAGGRGTSSSMSATRTRNTWWSRAPRSRATRPTISTTFCTRPSCTSTPSFRILRGGRRYRDLRLHQSRGEQRQPYHRSISGRTLTFNSDIFSGTGEEGGTVSLARNVPDLTCICECDNRIWGAEGTTIYASALGDPKNFYLYDGCPRTPTPWRWEPTGSSRAASPTPARSSSERGLRTQGHRVHPVNL